MKVPLRTVRYIALTMIISIIISLCAPAVSAAGSRYEPFDKADLKAAILVDADTGEILFEQGAHEKNYPASTTKMLTALMVIESIEAGKIGLDDEITMQRKLIDSVMYDASHVSPRLKADEKVTVEQLLYCVMIESDCAACNILGAYVAGSVEEFVRRMNIRAEQLGCRDTNFVNTHGYPHDDHYTTAYSLYLIAAEAMKHELFAKIVSTKEYVIPKTNLTRARTLVNTNWLLGMPADISSSNVKYDADYYYEYCVGIKTGYASAAGSCLASCAKKDGRTLICIVLGAWSLKLEDGTTRRRSFSESIRLFEWGFSNFSEQTYLTTADIVGEMPVTGGGRIESVGLRPTQSCSAMLPNGYYYTDLDCEVVTSASSVAAPVQSGTPMGTLHVSREGRLIAEVPLVASDNVAEATKFDLFVLWIAGRDTSTQILLANLAVLMIMGAWAAIAAMGRKRQTTRAMDAQYNSRAMYISESAPAPRRPAAPYDDRRPLSPSAVRRYEDERVHGGRY